MKLVLALVFVFVSFVLLPMRAQSPAQPAQPDEFDPYTRYVKPLLTPTETQPADHFPDQFDPYTRYNPTQPQVSPQQ